MYTAYYELRQEPFHVTPDPEFLFPSPAHKEALAAIIYGIEQRKGFVAITGEVGVGKTTILRSYLDFADRQSLKLIYVYNSNLTFDELVTTILQELGVADRPPTSFQAITRLHEELIEVYRKNQTVVLIIDEAQNMPVETLESLRMLSNLETVTEKLIQIMLIGQPELDELLQQHRLRQLRQRIAIHARIDPLNSEDSVAYLEHRLAKVAFGTKPVFTKNALRLIADSAQGIPRNLNILSDNALITGFGSQVRPVNARVVKEVLADRGVAPPPSQGVQRWRGAWVGGVAAAAAIIIITMAVLALNPSILKTGGPVLQSEQAPDRAAPPPSLAERAPANAPSGVEARAPAAASPPAAPKSRPTSGSTSLATRTVPENVQPAPEPPPPVAVAPAPLVQAPPRTAGTVRNEPPQPPARTAQPSPPEAPRAEPQATPPAPRLAAPPVAAPRAPEIARVEPPAPPRATEPPPAPPRPAAAPPVAVAPPRAAEPPRPAPSGAPETAANNAAPTPAPAARRAQPVPLQPPPAQRPAAVSPPPAPSVAAVPPPVAPPPAAAVAVPSIMMPSASGSGTVASLALAPDAIPPRAAAPARTDQSVRMVRVGDSLWTMAEDVYGFVNPNVLRRVQDANPQLRNINILTPGQEIVFPRVSETSLDRSATQFEGVPSAGRN